MKEWLEAIRVLGFWKTMYCRFIYRHHMKILHGHGLHWYSYSRPEGDYMRWCHWCGDRNVVKATLSNDGKTSEYRDG